MKHTNDFLLETFLKKVERDYAKDVALVFTYGSYVTGEQHAKSDLDLVFIPQTNRANELSMCFIVGDVGYDFFPMSWDRLERIASFEDPLTALVAQGKVVYAASPDFEERFDQLRSWIWDAIDAPLSAAMVEKAGGLIEKAMKSCALMQLSDDLGTVRECSGSALYDLCDAAAYLNNRYFRRGIKYRMEELQSLPQLPPDFEAQYYAVIDAKDIPEIREATWALLSSLQKMHARLDAATRSPEAPSQTLPGTYEEITCNWKNKLNLAVEENDKGLAFLTGVCYQDFLDMMMRTCGLPRIDFMKDFQADDLSALKASADRAEAEYLAILSQNDIKVRRYASAEAFAKELLDG